jgi:hypothetical protein
MKQLMLTQEKVAAEGIAVVIFFLCVCDQYDHKKERPQELLLTDLFCWVGVWKLLAL